MLHAVNEAQTKSSRGYLATGVAISSCRHALVRPNGAADLQRGERYVVSHRHGTKFTRQPHLHRYINTDYVFASSIQDDIKNGVCKLLVTYDIACQWGKNLKRHLSTYLPPSNLDLGLLSHRVAVPKFHLVGHGASCQVSYNLALMDGVGMTHGEGVETVWSHSTSLATWSRENGPGARHQILDDHWGSWNWRKTVKSRMSTFPASSILITDLKTQASIYGKVSKEPGSGVWPSVPLRHPWTRRSRRKRSSDGGKLLLSLRRIRQNQILLRNPK